MTTTELSQNDFFQGLIASLALRGIHKASIRTDNFDPVLHDVFDLLEQRAPEYMLDLTFEIIPDPTHKDSLTVRDALAACAGDGLISYDNPEYQDIEIKLGVYGARLLMERRFERLKPLFEELTDLFLERYSATPTH